MKMVALLLLTFLTLFGCVAEQGKTVVNIKRNPSAITQINTASVSSIAVVNNQVVVSGNNLNVVTGLKINGTAFSELFTIESKTSSQIVANANRAFSFDISKIFELVLSDAHAAATFPIAFDLTDGSVTAPKLNSMGALTGQVLKYNGTAWVPSTLSNSQVYLGTYDANTNTPDLNATTPIAGDYYIVTTAGTYGADNFEVGDWIMHNGSAWEKISNSTNVVSSFNGRRGIVTPAAGDYSWTMLTTAAGKLTGSKLEHIADIDLTGIADNKILKWDATNSKWIIADDLSGGGAGSVTSTEIADASITNADISASAAIDYSKLSIADGDIPMAKVNGLSTALSGILAPTIVDADTTHAPDGNAVFDALGLKLNLTGGTLTVGGTITGLPALPLAGSEATSKDYVDGQITTVTTAANTKVAKTGDTMSGVLTLDNDLKIKGGASYVTVRGHASSAAYNMVLPSSAGTGGYVLSTDGAGNTSWINPSTVVTGTGTVNSASITDGSIVDADVNATANIAQSKIANLTTDLSAITTSISSLTTTDVAEGTNLYFLNSRVLGVDLAGLNTGVAGPIAATDTVLGAFGKLQYQVTDLKAKGQWEKNVNDIYYNTGNVGIGTNTPTAPLEVNGNIKASTFNSKILSDGGQAGSLVIGAGASAVSTASVVIGDSATNPVGGGSVVAVGNSADARVYGVAIGKLAKAGAYAVAIGLGADAQTNVSTSGVALGRGALLTGNNQFVVGGASASLGVANSYLGSGVTDTTPLSHTINATSGSGTDVAGANLTLSAGRGTGAGAGGYLAFQTSTAGATGTVLNTASERMRITNSGNVGIGTSVPDARLDISGGVLEISGSVAPPGGGSDRLAIGSIDSSYKWLQTYNSQVLVLNPVGNNVGVGTVTPQSKLDVAGSIRIGADATLCTAANAGAMKFNSPNVEYCNGTAWTAFSASGAAVASAQITDGTIVNADINAAAAIDATKINTGVVDNIEFNYLDGVTSSIQTQLNGKQATDATLTSLAAFNANGILVQTAADTFVGRSIAGTANRVSVNNGDGVLGNPTINLDTSLLPSPLAGDAGKFLKASGADASAWAALASGDITTALGFTPVNKAGDSFTTGTFALSGTAALTVQDPVNLLDAANKQYVDSYGQWTKSGSDIYFSGGNVGVGTSTPNNFGATSRTLEVSGSEYGYLRVKGGTHTLDFMAWNGGLSEIRAASDLAVKIGGTERLRVDSTGELGIGTSAPQSLLHLNNNNVYQLRFTNPTTAATAVDGVGIGLSGSELQFNSLESAGYKFRSGAVDLVTIAGAGNVGIGTTTPTSLLHLNQAASNSLLMPLVLQNNDATDTGGSATSIGFRVANTAAAKAAIAFERTVANGRGKIHLLVNDTNDTSTAASLADARLTVANTGYVGIGTTAPGTLLDIQGSIATSNGAAVKLFNTNAGNTNRWMLGAGGGIIASDAFSIGDNSEYRFVINSSGNVGLGTIAPVSRLHVNANITGAAPATSGTTVSTGLVSRLANAGGATLDHGMLATGTQWLQATHVNDQSFSYPIALNPNGGSVGVGTAVPNAKFEVVTSTLGTALNDVAELMRLNNGNGNASYLDFRQLRTSAGATWNQAGTRIQQKIDSTWMGYMQFNGTGNEAGIAFGTGQTTVAPGNVTELMRLTSTGRVGIGTTAPGYKLEVVGGNIGAPGFTTTSDRRLKTNIETIDDALIKVLGLRGVEFDWKSNGEHEVGLIAQEVEKIEPTLVMTKPDGFKGVKYSNIVALLIEAMKIEHRQIEKNMAMMKTMQTTLLEHGRKIASLEEKNEKLNKELTKQKAENQQIKQYLCLKDPHAPFCQ